MRGLLPPAEAGGGCVGLQSGAHRGRVRFYSVLWNFSHGSEMRGEIWILIEKLLKCRGNTDNWDLGRILEDLESKGSENKNTGLRLCPSFSLENCLQNLTGWHIAFEVWLLGDPSKKFGQSWDFVPTGLTPTIRPERWESPKGNFCLFCILGYSKYFNSGSPKNVAAVMNIPPKKTLYYIMKSAALILIMLLSWRSLSWHIWLFFFLSRSPAAPWRNAARGWDVLPGGGVFPPS